MALHQIKAGEDEITAGAGLAISKKLSGLIFLGGSFDYTHGRVASIEVPFVCCTYTNSFGTLHRSTFSSVSINDEEEARKAVQYLIDRGHRKIAVLLDSVEDHSISELRYKGYLKALREAGIEPDPGLVQETVLYEMSAAYSGMQRLIGRRKDFTAVFAIADSFGIAAVRALHDAGREVPDDCSVIAIDGIEMSEYTVPSLTTLVQPSEEMGTQAVRALMNVIEGKGETVHLYLSTALREGESVRSL